MLNPEVLRNVNIHTHDLHQDCETNIALINIFAHEPEKILTGPSMCYYTIGLHPWYLKKTSIESALKSMEEAVGLEQVIAFGEAGIDKAIDTEQQWQEEAFVAQVQLSEKWKKPLIIHCVKAFNDLLRIRKETRSEMPWIFHGFNGNRQIAEDLVAHNCYLSFGKWIMRGHEKTVDVFMNEPADHFFCETDEEDLMIEDVYAEGARLRGCTPGELQKQMLHNFNSCFFDEHD